MSMRDEQSSSDNQPSSTNDPQIIPAPQDVPADDAAYLRKLLETLSVEDPAVFNELMMANSQLAEEYHRADPQIGRIHDALTGDALPVNAGLNDEKAQHVDAEFAKLVAQIKERLARGNEAILSGTSGPFELPQHAGILTDVTRQLSAEQARQLFEKLAPMLVYATLRHLDCNSSFAEVDRIAGHLCSDDVQTKLRQAEHTRDALVDEFVLAIVEQGVGSSESDIDGIGVLLNRDQMTRLLEECGAMGDLVAMSNCILLAKTQAG